MNTDSKRQAQVFILSETDTAQMEPSPGQLSKPRTATYQDDYPHLTLEKLPIKGVRSLCIGIAIALLTFFIYQFYSLAASALATHWTLFAAVLLLSLFLAGQSIRIVLQLVSRRRDLDHATSLQKMATTLHERRDKGLSDQYKTQLLIYFDGKPQSALLTTALDSLPDYADDGETLCHLEKRFISKLDNEAEQRIAQFSARSGVAVALSPWVSLDLLICLWRSLKLIDEIAQIYGIRPSFQTRYRLLKLVLEQLVVVGVTEWTLDQLIQDAGIQSVATFAGAGITQGLGAGLYTCRIGLVAMDCCRPAPFQCLTKPTMRSLMKPLFNQLAALVKK